MKILNYFTTNNGKTYGIAFLLVIIMFHIIYGLGVLVPTNITWLMDAHHDWGTHYLGWAFFKDEPWSFPLGKVNNYISPVGTNVGLTDSIVLMSILLKPFSFMLPEDFQYIGVWLLFCHLLAAFYTIKIFNLYNVKLIYVILGVLLIACNPVLIYRSMHPSLCIHGFIIASIYYYLKPGTLQNVYLLNRNQVVLVILSSLISPYITLIIGGFTVILPFKHYFYDKLIPLKKVFIYPAISLIAVLVLWYITGVISFGEGANLQGGEYGLYGFNLNSFHNPVNSVSLLPQLPYVTWHQYEGYMYLGAGIMLLILCSLIYIFVSGSFKNILKNNKALLPLLLLAFILLLFAITNNITFNDKTLFTFPLPKFVMWFGGVFRAAGRFVWLGYYLILFFFILIFVKSKFNNTVKIIALALLTLVQVYDLKSSAYASKNFKYGAYDSPLDEAKWGNLLPGFKKLITYPPFNNHLLNNMDYQDLCFVALKHNMPITMGYSAREDVANNKIYTDSLTEALNNGKFNEDEIFVTTRQYLEVFSPALHSDKMTLDYIDGYYVLYSKKNNKTLFSQTPTVKKQLDSIKYANSPATDFVKIIDKPVFSKDKIHFNPEELIVNGNIIQAKGWAFLEATNNNKGDSVFVTISDATKTYIAKTKQLLRPDLANAYKKQYLDNSGFSSTVFAPGSSNYTVGLAIKTASGQWTFTELSSMSDISKGDTPEKLDMLPVQDKQMGNIDEFTDKKDYQFLSGWTAFENIGSEENVIRVVLSGKKGFFAVNTKGLLRNDVTRSKKTFNYDNSGFMAKVRKEDLPKGEYRVGLLITNKTTKQESLLMTDKVLKVK